MSSASVGWQCPECVKEFAKSAPVVSARRAMSKATPIVTYVLIGLNVAVFVAGFFTGDGLMGSSGGEIFQRFSLYPPFLRQGEWYRLITGGFLHDGAIHIGLNMFVLYIVGRELEPAIGKARFALVYAVSLFGGALGVVLLDPQAATVGASGAIFGTFGLLAVLQYSRGINPLSSGIGPTILLNLVITFTLPGISKGGHIGGLVVGAAVGAVMFLGTDISRQPANERLARAGLVAAIGVACIVAALVAAPSVVLTG